MRRLILLCVLMLLTAALPAAGQTACALPSDVTVTACPSKPDKVGQPGEFDFYVLALSWSPAYCAKTGTEQRRTADHQCRANRFGFVVHGLWPQYADRRQGEGWPQFCTATPPVAAPTVRRSLCTVPGEQLIQCEWAKHGTCSDLPTPELYFSETTRLFAALRLPALPALPARSTVGEVSALLMQANPGLPAAALRLVADTRRDGPPLLTEIRLCYRRDRQAFQSCTATVGGFSPARPDHAARPLFITEAK